MALAISSIPVLTGDAANDFENKARQSYESYLNRSETEKRIVAEHYAKGMATVNKVLAKSHIGKK